MGAIDVDRGVEIRRDPITGVLVYMYNDTPGEYFNAHGKPLDPAYAGRLGFDIDRHAKLKLKREKMAEFMNRLEIELELANEAKEEVILETRGDYKLVKQALGRADVVSIEDGERMNDHPIPVEEAKILLEALAGPAVVGKGKH